jgi:hypothetical protein
MDRQWNGMLLMSRYTLALNKKVPRKRKKPEKAVEALDLLRVLRKDIEDIVTSHSGGLKLTELIPELITKRKNLKIKIETIIEVIDSSPNLRILEYTWRTNNRTKYFIYTLA